MVAGLVIRSRAGVGGGMNSRCRCPSLPISAGLPGNAGVAVYEAGCASVGISAS
jgi:hypothetical protein